MNLLCISLKNIDFRDNTKGLERAFESLRLHFFMPKIPRKYWERSMHTLLSEKKVPREVPRLSGKGFEAE